MLLSMLLISLVVLQCVLALPPERAFHGSLKLGKQCPNHIDSDDCCQYALRDHAFDVYFLDGWGEALTELKLRDVYISEAIPRPAQSINASCRKRNAVDNSAYHLHRSELPSFLCTFDCQDTRAQKYIEHYRVYSKKRFENVKHGVTRQRMKSFRPVRTLLKFVMFCPLHQVGQVIDADDIFLGNGIQRKKAKCVSPTPEEWIEIMRKQRIEDRENDRGQIEYEARKELKLGNTFNTRFERSRQNTAEHQSSVATSSCSDLDAVLTEANLHDLFADSDDDLANWPELGRISHLHTRQAQPADRVVVTQEADFKSMVQSLTSWQKSP